LQQRKLLTHLGILLIVFLRELNLDSFR